MRALSMTNSLIVAEKFVKQYWFYAILAGIVVIFCAAILYQPLDATYDENKSFDVNEDKIFSVKSYVCYYEEDGDKIYETYFPSAVDNADGRMITLLTDIQVIYSIVVNYTLYINLNGYNLCNEQKENTILVQKGGVLHVTDLTSENPAGHMYNPSDNANCVIYNKEGGNVIIDGGNFGWGTSSANPAAINRNVIINEGTVTLNSGCYKSTETTVINQKKGTLCINGGTFQCTNNSYCLIGAHPEANVVITDGKFETDADQYLFKILPGSDGDRHFSIFGGTYTIPLTAPGYFNIESPTQSCVYIAGGIFSNLAPPYDFIDSEHYMCKWSGDWKTFEIVPKSDSLIEVTFNSNGGSEVKSVKCGYNYPMSAPSDPERDGYVFKGWYLDEDHEYVFNQPVTSNLTLFAKWFSTKISVKFYLDGEKVIETQDVKLGEKTLKPNDPTKGLEKFVGWYYKSTCESNLYTSNNQISPTSRILYDFSKAMDDSWIITMESSWIMTGILELQALWASDTENTVDIFFNTNGGSLEDTQHISYGGIADKPENPQKAYNIFAYWYVDSKPAEPFNYDSQIYQSTYIYAKWYRDHDIVFDSNGGEGEMDSVTFRQIMGGTLPKCLFTNMGQTFVGWATEDGRYIEDEAQLNTPLTDRSSITLYALWDGFEAQVGDKKFANLQQALNAAEDGGTVTVLRDIVFSSVAETQSWLYIDKSITLQGLKDKNIQIHAYQPSTEMRRVISIGDLTSDDINVKIKDIDIVAQNYHSNMTLMYVSNSVKSLEIANCALKGGSASLEFVGDGKQQLVATINNSSLESGTALDIHNWVNITINDSSMNGNNLFFRLYSMDDKASNILLQRSILTIKENNCVDANDGYSFTMIDCSVSQLYKQDCFFFNSCEVDSDLQLNFRLVNCVFKLGSNGGIIHGGQKIEGQKDLIGGEISVNPLRIEDNPNGFLDEEYYVAEKDAEEEFFVVKWKINLYDGPQIWSNTTVAYAGLDSEGKEYGVSETPSSHPEREGYGFTGWYVDPECTEKYEFNQKVYAGFNLYAGYIKQFPVSFDPGEGRPIPEVQFVDEGSKAIKPSGENEPKLNGMKLTGWYTNQEFSEKYDFNTPVNKELKLYAKWEIVEYIISFDSQGGSPTPKEQKKHYGEYVTEPSEADVPSRAGYTFAGWYKDKEGVERYYFSAPVVDNLILYAKWNPNKIVVTFDAQGGKTSITTKEVLMGSKYGTLPTTTQYGYNFIGWFTEADGGIRIMSESVVNIPNDHTLYAHWTPNEGESLDILDDGSKVDEKFKTEKDEQGRLVTTIDSIILKMDGTTEYSVSKSVKESIDTGEKVVTQATTTFMDSNGNTLSIMTTSSTEIRTGNYVILDSNSVEKDVTGKVIATITMKSTAEESVDGTIKTESTETIDTGHTRTVIRTDSEYAVFFGSTKTSTTCVESVVTSEGTSTSTTVSDTFVKNASTGKVKEVEERIVKRTASSETYIIETTSTTTVKNSGTTAEITEESVTTCKDADEKILNIQNYTCTTKILDSTRTKSSVLEISYPDDSKSTVKYMTSIDDGELAGIASATVTDEQGTVTRSANAVLSYFDSSETLQSSDVENGLAQIDSVIEAMGESKNKFMKVITVESENTYLKAAPESFGSLADNGSSLRIESGYGVLIYDSDACKTFAGKDSDVEIKLDLNDPEDLNEKQKTTIGDSTFISITAESDSKYISEIGGTVTMSFMFDNPKGWEHFRVYYIDEDGVKHRVPTTYDEETGCITATSTHHSVYAVLEIAAHSISVSTIGNGKVSVSPSGDVLEGETITLMAVAGEGYLFDGWECDQILIVDNSFTMPDTDVYITGVFYEDLEEKNRQTIMIFIIVVAIAAALVIGLIIYRRHRLY